MEWTTGFRAEGPYDAIENHVAPCLCSTKPIVLLCSYFILQHNHLKRGWNLLGILTADGEAGEGINP
jgi:hypothetical protein